MCANSPNVVVSSLVGSRDCEKYSIRHVLTCRGKPHTNDVAPGPFDYKNDLRTGWYSCCVALGNFEFPAYRCFPTPAMAAMGTKIKLGTRLLAPH